MIERRAMSMKERVSIWVAVLSLIIALVTVMGYIAKASVIPAMMTFRITNLEDRLAKRETKFDPMMDRQEKQLIELAMLAQMNTEQHIEIKEVLKRIEHKVDRQN